MFIGARESEALDNVGEVTSTLRNANLICINDRILADNS